MQNLYTASLEEKLLRIRSLLTAALLAGGLLAVGSGAAAASPTTYQQAEGCTLDVSDLYISIGMFTANADLTGGCSGPIYIVMEQGSSPSGPFPTVYDPDYLQRSSDGTSATAYFADPPVRGYCQAKATANGLTAVSDNAVPC